MNNQVPFLDLVTPHTGLENEFAAVFRDAMKSGRFIGGPMVEEFEQDFARYCTTNYSVGVASGTDALRFALLAAGIKRGDVVLTVANTFIATTEAISQAGAIPEFVDIDERTYNMDPEKLRIFLKKQCSPDDQSGKLMHFRTGSPVTAVIPVHLYGQVADMDPILAIAEEYKLTVIEDACQAHGAEYFSQTENRWRRAGSMGKAAAFSFYPGKNLGAFGEAGAVSTDDEEIALKVRMLRDHGQMKKYHHEIEGYNGRLDAIQAGILRVKLRHLADWNEQRRTCAYRYNTLLAGLDGIVTPREPLRSKAVYHLYVIRTRWRDELQAFLAQRDISTGLHYPIPLHRQKAYTRFQRRKKDLTVSETVADQILSLPMYPGLTETQQLHVAESIREFDTSQGVADDKKAFRHYDKAL